MADLPEGVDEVEEQPVQPEELGDPSKFTWEDENGDEPADSDES